MQPIELALDVISRETSGRESKRPHFHDERYKAHALSKDNFKPIKEASLKKTIFVDGGEMEIISAPNFSLHLIRVAASCFKGGERIELSIPRRVEFYCATYSKANDAGDIMYVSTLVPMDPSFAEYLPDAEDLRLSSWDKTLVKGMFQAKITSMAGVVRRLAEWRIATRVMEKEMNSGDMLVRDGTLQSSVTGEGKYMAESYSVAGQKGIIFTGLAKTSSIFTDAGESLASAIQKISPEGTWCYTPVADIDKEDHQAFIAFVRLHEHSKHAFRFEIWKKQADVMSPEEANSILWSLAENSKDASFPGYPYGLIDADRFARVVQNERAYHRSMFSSLAGKRDIWDDIERSLVATDAHVKLNRVV